MKINPALLKAYLKEVANAVKPFEEEWQRSLELQSVEEGSGWWTLFEEKKKVTAT
jgi:hypothetical protein